MRGSQKRDLICTLQYDVHQDDLFIPRYSSGVLDPDGHLDANIESLPIGDQLAAHEMPDVNDLLIRRWRGMDLEYLRIKDFVATFKDESLS